MLSDNSSILVTGYVVEKKFWNIEKDDVVPDNKSHVITHSDNRENKNEEYVREVLSHDKCCLNMGKFTDSITFKCRESVNLCVRY